MKRTSKYPRATRKADTPVNSSAVDYWLRHATGVAKGRFTTDKIMKITRGDTEDSPLCPNRPAEICCDLKILAPKTAR